MKVIFDVGSFDGNSCNEIIKNKGWGNSCIAYLFEPHPTLAKIIRENIVDTTRVFLIEKAVCEKNGKSNFYLSSPIYWQEGWRKIGGACSLLKFRTNEEIAKSWFNTVNNQKVPCPDRVDLFYSGTNIEVDTIRLDTFIEENKINCIDYLHIDAQGCDLNVLRSLGSYAKIVKEGCCEAYINGNGSVYVSENDSSYLEDIKKWLDSNGFEILSISPNVPYSADGVTPNEWNIFFKNKNL